MTPVALGPEAWEAVAVSLRVSTVATVVALPLAVLVALVLARGRFPGRQALDVAVHLPLVLPPVVTGYALLLAFGRDGPVGGVLDAWFGVSVAFRWTGAALAAGVMAFPLMVRAVRLSVDAVDPGLEEAARTLGASRPGVFFGVTLPLIAPGVVAAAVLGFAKALGEFGATITFVSSIPGETRTLPSAVFGYLQRPSGEATALALSGLAALLAVGALLMAERLSQAAARRVRGA